MEVFNSSIKKYYSNSKGTLALIKVIAKLPNEGAIKSDALVRRFNQIIQLMNKMEEDNHRLT